MYTNKGTNEKNGIYRNAFPHSSYRIPESNILTILREVEIVCIYTVIKKGLKPFERMPDKILNCLITINQDARGAKLKKRTVLTLPGSTSNSVHLWKPDSSEMSA
jgi:hypothetical protein